MLIKNNDFIHCTLHETVFMLVGRSYMLVGRSYIPKLYCYDSLMVTD